MNYVKDLHCDKLVKPCAANEMNLICKVNSHILYLIVKIEQI